MQKIRESSKSKTPSIKECLEIIGIKELTANIYSLPKKSKKSKCLTLS